jgi:N-acyl homoserine lactone hydrolase
MKLQFLPAGRLRLKKSVYIKTADRSETFEAPVSSALIRHKQGNVLFDTGCHPSVIEHGEERWGSLMKVMTPVMRGGHPSAESGMRRRQPRRYRYRREFAFPP